jgi:Meiotically up-regulated gene 113
MSADMKKEHILSEIRRTAETNGGVALGKERFLHETGIKESDWKGKLWARWNDAVREAGVEPNQLTIAYDENLLIEKFIAVMRDFGRFPVTAELRIKKLDDPTLPNDKTYRRFGSKQQFATKILDYCSSRAGYDDVAAMCAGIVDRGNSVAVASAEPEDAIGFVYLVKSGRFHKIGRSNSIGRREYELAIQLPDKANTVHTIRTDDPIGIEAYWHKRFETKRKNGEWFELDAKDVSAFKRRKFM